MARGSWPQDWLQALESWQKRLPFGWLLCNMEKKADEFMAQPAIEFQATVQADGYCQPTEAPGMIQEKGEADQ